MTTYYPWFIKSDQNFNMWKRETRIEEVTNYKVKGLLLLLPFKTI